MKRPLFRYTMCCTFLCLGATLFCFVAAPRAVVASTQMAFDFQGSAAREWSTSDTFAIEGNKILGLFNNVSKNYLQGTHLKIEKVPAKTAVTVSFDLYLVGSWDSGGQLADRWTLSVEKGKTLIELTKFPNAYKDTKETIPTGNNGIAVVNFRKLAYWVVKETVVVPPDQIVEGSVNLSFRGFVTGRSTEFWGLDNVTVKIGD
jgi:hypothetical protein